MAITIPNASVEDFSSTAGTSHTQNLSTANTGDLRVMVIAGNPDGTGTVPTINLPTGWTGLGSQQATGAASDGMLWAIYRVVQGGDSSPLTITTTQTCMMATICTTYVGQDPTPIDQTTPTYDVTENPPTSPAITTQTDNARVVVATLVDGEPGFGDSDIPSGMTLRGTMVNNPPSNGQNLGMADYDAGSLGAKGSFDWGSGAGTEEAVSLTIAIRALDATYSLSGITKDSSGSPLGSCDVFLLHDNLDDTFDFVDYQVSNVSTGAYSFTGLADSANFMVIAWKDDSPHVFDATDYVLTGTLE